MSADEGDDLAAPAGGDAPDQGKVGLGHLAVGEKPPQTELGIGGLGGDETPRRVLVQPVDDPRPLHSADPGEGIAAVMEQRIHQRAALMPGGGVDDHPLGLVDDQQVLILKEDIQRDLLRLRIRLRGLRKIQMDPFPRGQPPVLLPGFPLHQDAALFQKLLDPAAAEVRETQRQESIQTETGVLRRRGQYPLHPRPPSPLRCVSGGSRSPPGKR